MSLVLERALNRTSSRILGCASQGAGGDDEARLRGLLQGFDADFVPFNRKQKKESFTDCLRQLRTGNFDLFVLEGTGFGGGLAAILGRLIFKRPYVFSSGDAVAPFLSAQYPLGAPIFGAYERLLYRCCSGFIGWTPYLVGRALTLGARRAISVPGWAPYSSDRDALLRARSEIRRNLGIPQDAIVFGLVGSLVWSKRAQYSYGLELVRAAAVAGCTPYVLIVGDGGGLPHLRELAGDALGRTIFLPGRVARQDVPAYLAAMDVGSLPQTVDGVGSFRYTTKISEYRDVGLPFVTSQIPLAYDLDCGDIWRLPGKTPWSTQFIEALAQLMKEVTRDQIAAHRVTSGASREFNREDQVRSVTEFLEDILKSLCVSE